MNGFLNLLHWVFVKEYIIFLVVECVDVFSVQEGALHAALVNLLHIYALLQHTCSAVRPPAGVNSFRPWWIAGYITSSLPEKMPSVASEQPSISLIRSHRWVQSASDTKPPSCPMKAAGSREKGEAATSEGHVEGHKMLNFQPWREYPHVGYIYQDDTCLLVRH